MYYKVYFIAKQNKNVELSYSYRWLLEYLFHISKSETFIIMRYQEKSASILYSEIPPMQLSYNSSNFTSVIGSLTTPPITQG